MIRAYRYIIVLVLLTGLPVLHSAGQAPYPFQHSLNLELENHLYQSKDLSFASLKPLYPFLHSNPQTLDSLFYPQVYQDFRPGQRSWFARKMFYENFYSRDSANIQLTINPVLDLTLQRNTGSDPMLYNNTRGITARVNLFDKVYIATHIYETQSRFPRYIKQRIRSTRMIPGMGKANPFGDGGHDYYYSSGRIAWRPNEKNTLIAGHGKQFVGGGYRSLLLSDVPYHFPHLQYLYQDQNFQYSKTVALLQHEVEIENPVSPGREKTGVFHYVAGKIGSHLEVGLFEGNIVDNPDSKGAYSFYAGYINPVPLLNSLLPYNNIETHSLVGLNVNYRPTHTLNLYGQLALDEPFRNRPVDGDASKWSGQAGVKLFEPLGVQNLILQSELNISAPHTYGDERPTLTYTHFHEPMAHPFGSNFIENVSWVHYRYRRFAFQGEVLFAKYGQDNVTGRPGRLFFSDLEISWIVNPAYDMRVFAGYTYREENGPDVGMKDGFVKVGVKTGWINRYFDF